MCCDCARESTKSSAPFSLASATRPLPCNSALGGVRYARTLRACTGNSACVTAVGFCYAFSERINAWKATNSFEEQCRQMERDRSSNRCCSFESGPETQLPRPVSGEKYDEHWPMDDACGDRVGMVRGGRFAHSRREDSGDARSNAFDGGSRGFRPPACRRAAWPGMPFSRGRMSDWS